MIKKISCGLGRWMGLTETTSRPILPPLPYHPCPHTHKSEGKTKIYLTINKPDCWEWSVNLDYYHRDGDHPARLVDGFYWYYDKGKIIKIHGSKER